MKAFSSAFFPLFPSEGDEAGESRVVFIGSPLAPTPASTLSPFVPHEERVEEEGQSSEALDSTADDLRESPVEADIPACAKIEIDFP
ncbi:MAG: hypothetical protein HYY23_16225 [Verrucomicrobia bacterium]|nr:hypothetical protein [Verrucomicrobiota bacterium]